MKIVIHDYTHDTMMTRDINVGKFHGILSTVIKTRVNEIIIKTISKEDFVWLWIFEPSNRFVRSTGCVTSHEACLHAHALLTVRATSCQRKIASCMEPLVCVSPSHFRLLFVGEYDYFGWGYVTAKVSSDIRGYYLQRHRSTTICKER